MALAKERTAIETVTQRGLSAPQVEANRKQYGTNLLTPPPRDPWWTLFLEKFEDPVIRILTIAAIVAIFAGTFNGNYIEGLGIIAAILLATILAFLNEYRASREFDILNQVNEEVPVKVIRDGIYTTVPKKDVVVGDIVLLEIDDEIPADGRIIEAVSLKVNEANLTGESVPATKVASEIAEVCDSLETTYSCDRVLRGTVVANGQGTIEITAVGDNTEIGKTARDATEEIDANSPLNQQLDRLSKLIGVLGLAVAILTDIALVVRGVVVGELNLTPGQWYFTTFLVLGILVALVKVWLPVVGDGFELAGRELNLPEWLEDDSAIAWLQSIFAGIAIVATGIGFGYAFNWLPSEVSNWLPANVATLFLTYFMVAVTIIVVAVPEGLALSVTLSLAYSMRKMTRQNNLVRRMNACETIGAATVICSDKTGTITRNEMRVSDVNFANSDREFVSEAICGNTIANLERMNAKTIRPLGDPTEGALLLWLEENDVDYVSKRNQFSIVNRWAFSTDRKYMATLGVSLATGEMTLHVKGAPEILLERCDRILTAGGVEELRDRRPIETQLQECETRGLRMLGFAYIEEPNYQPEMPIEELVEGELIWLGFVAISDPIRSDVPNAIAICQTAGIEVKMITGDNPVTAKEIARQIGLVDDSDGEESYLTGLEFEELDDEQAKVAVAQLKVLSRARPKDKQRLVKLLQENGEVVAVTGNGTNDAPALNQAQVGLAMGQNSTAIAKEASDIIILDRAFESIENAVMWGRSLYQNIQKFILFQLTINVAACGIALLGPFIGIDLPLTVTQLLWVNLIMDTFAALALATEPPNEKVMENPPRNPEDFIISKSMALNIFTVSPLFLAFLVGFLMYIQQDGIVTAYELSAFFTTFVMLQFWNLFNAKCFSLKQSVFAQIGNNLGFTAIAATIFIGQILMVQFGGKLFRTVPLSGQDWLLIVAGTSIVFWIGEIWRAIARLKSKTA